MVALAPSQGGSQADRLSELDACDSLIGEALDYCRTGLIAVEKAAWSGDLAAGDRFARLHRIRAAALLQAQRIRAERRKLLLGE